MYSVEIDWLIISCFTSRSRIFHIYRDITIAGEGLENLGLCSALKALEQGGPHLLWHGTSVFPVRSIQSPLMTRMGVGRTYLTGELNVNVKKNFVCFILFYFQRLVEEIVEVLNFRYLGIIVFSRTSTFWWETNVYKSRKLHVIYVSMCIYELLETPDNMIYQLCSNFTYFTSKNNNELLEPVGDLYTSASVVFVGCVGS
jgi:hypothetical protein